MTGTNCKEVDMLCTVIARSEIKYHHKRMKYDSASSCCSKMNMTVCQPGGYAGGACNKGVNIISENDDRENSDDDADANTSVATSI
eukprot:3392625-Ditylum_brightwellii.AAC.1